MDFFNSLLVVAGAVVVVFAIDLIDEAGRLPELDARRALIAKRFGLTDGRGVVGRVEPLAVQDAAVVVQSVGAVGRHLNPPMLTPRKTSGAVIGCVEPSAA